MHRVAVLCALSAPFPGNTWAAPTLDREVALRTSQAAIGTRVGPHVLTDQSGRPIALGSFAGRPALVSFIYTSCAHTCPVITQRLAGAVDEARDVLGEGSFSVLTIGFDSPADSPERMRDYALQRHIDQRNWYFLSADPETIRALTAEFGFVYIPAPHGFDHLAQVTVLDGNGRIHSQIYGDDFRPESIVEPLRQLLLGTTTGSGGLGALVNRVRLICTVYDPATGRYGFDYSLLLTGLTGIMSLGAIFIFIVANWRHGTTRERMQRAPGELPQ